MSFFNRDYNLKDLSDLQGKINVDRYSRSIALIDDKIFSVVQGLRKHGFNINYFEDIENIDIIKGYDIIISDIKGVGKHLNSKLEGAHLLHEIHKRYPTKYLISYSDSVFDPTYNDYFKLCDVVKRKNVDIHDWVNTIEMAIKNINDPIYQWEKIRKILVENRFSTDWISKIEKGYIKSFVKKNDKYLLNNLTQTRGLSDSPAVKIAIESISAFAAEFIISLINHGHGNKS
jgi:hypothetical protein